MANEYATREEIKTRISLTGEADDATIDLLREAASRKIDRYCNRPSGHFYAATETRYFTATDSECLQVGDLLSITTLRTDNGGNRTYSATWSSGDYDLLPYNAALEYRPYDMVKRVSSGSKTFPTGEDKGVMVTGSFGYAASTPPEIREACIQLVIRFFHRRNSPFGVVGSGDIGTFRISSIDPDVQGWLEPFRIPGMA